MLSRSDSRREKVGAASQVSEVGMYNKVLLLVNAKVTVTSTVQNHIVSNYSDCPQLVNLNILSGSVTLGYGCGDITMILNIMLHV